MMSPLGLLDVHPRRKATIRTRGDLGHLTSALRAFFGGAPPTGFTRLFAHGYFYGGVVSDREFRVIYQCRNSQNPQSYVVDGTIEDVGDWRVVDLVLTARSAWLGGRAFVGYLGLLVFLMVMGRGPRSLSGALSVLMFAIGALALVNAFYVPGVVKEKVSHHLAAVLHGSVRQGDEWVVPRDV